MKENVIENVIYVEWFQLTVAKCKYMFMYPNINSTKQE